MADYIKDIIAADRYTGNAGIGDSIDGVIQIDTRPIQQLAAYTVMYKKSLWEQNQKDAAAQAEQLANLTAYDLNTAIPKDREQIQKQWDELYNYVQKNPNVLDYKNNKQGWMEYNKKKNEFENNLRGAKTRSIIYDSRKKEISTITNPKLKKLNETELENDANSTGLRTPLPYAQKYDDSPIQMPQATSVKVPVTKRNPNDIFDEEHELWDANSATAESNVFAMGLNQPIDEGTPEGKRKAIAIRGNFWIEGKDVFNSSMGSYKDENGNIDISKIKGISKDLVALAEKLNAYSAEKNIEIDAGVYGKLLNHYPTINWKDGISADELALMANFASWKGDKVTRKIVETNDAIELQRIAAENERNRYTQQQENYRAGLERATQRYIANLPYEKKKLGAVGVDGRPLDFGNIINNVNTLSNQPIDIIKGDGTKIPNVKINNGVFVDEKGDVVPYTGNVKIPVSTVDNAIISEFNKYSAGTNKLTASKIVPDNGFLTVKMENGEIQGIRTDDGTYASANQFQHITLEAGQKGATKYKKADTNYGKVTSGNVRVEVGGKVYEVPETSLSAMDKDKVKYKRL